jgi:hypothetical protein
MGIPVLSGLLDSVGKAIDTVADKIAPDKNIQLQTEADLEKFKLRLRNDLEAEIMKQALSEQGFLLKDVEGARRSEIELAKLEPPLVRYMTGLVRGLFRPLVGFAAIGSFIWSQFLAPYWGFRQIDLDPYATGIVGLIVTFYYGGRTLEKIRSQTDR